MNAFFIMPVIWLSIIVASVFFEAATERLIAIWLAPSAGLTLIFGVIGMSLYWQVIFFVCASAFLILFSQILCSVFKRRKKHNDTEDGIE